MSQSHAGPSAIRHAISRWNRELERGDAALAMHQALLQGQQERGLTYGDRVISTILRPRFISEATWQQARRIGAVFQRSLGRLMGRLRGDSAMLETLGIRDRLQELVRMPHAGADDLWFLRLDGFLDRGIVRLVEFNVDSPGGAAFVDGLAEVYGGLEVFRRFTREVPLYRRASTPLIRRCVLAAVERARAAGLAPQRGAARVAILDWNDVSTRREFDLIRDDLERHGVPCVVADPRAVEVARGRAVVGGKPIHVVLKRVLVTDLAQRHDEVQPLLRAIRKGLVYCLNPTACQAVTTKSLLALFHEGLLDRHLTPAAAQVWRAHVPWTVRVREGRVRRDGRSVDLLDHLVRHRLRMVLKPSDAYGAEGIVLGWKASPSEWAGHLESALRAGDFVAQERVALPTEPFPLADGGRLRYERMHVEISPYTFHPATVSECLSRLSASDFLNVKTGGGVVATYVLR